MKRSGLGASLTPAAAWMNAKKDWEVNCTAAIRGLKEYNLRVHETGVTSKRLPPIYEIEKELKESHLKAKVQPQRAVLAPLTAISVVRRSLRPRRRRASSTRRLPTRRPLRSLPMTSG